MKVGVLGAGNIGGTLGKRWAHAGHTVQFGVREANSPHVQAFVSELGAQAAVGTMASAIAFGDVVVFAIPGGAMEATIRTHAAALNGKIVIDAANRMGAPTMNSAAVFAAQAPLVDMVTGLWFALANGQRMGRHLAFKVLTD